MSIRDLGRGDPWFEDGNIILMTDELSSRTAFRLHRGVLARHSEIFRDMFTLPPTTEVETYDNCQVVYMYDHPVELSILVKALYDGITFNNRNVDDFFYLSGILRLSTKYFINHLRTQAIQHLVRTWACTLKGHDTMVDTALNSPVVDDISYPYVHPLLVLNLAREVNISIILPSAFYFLSIYPLIDILRGDHPKLALQHVSKPASTLSSDDLRSYTLMYQHRLYLNYDFVRHFCGERATTPKCSNAMTCGRAFARLASYLSRSCTLKTSPLYYMRQVIGIVNKEPTFCEICRLAFQQDVDALRVKIWKELPEVIAIPGWPELEAADLPA
ncbi:hypothetical protein BDQ17DRAFT_1386956 [Cyathus striatus]|nr:hypothetical protein BDQ17DRAFT_1386956 [Cyathus striatus]